MQRYRTLATLENNTCARCASLEDIVYDMADYKPGVTAPPFHANCRCTTVPVFEDEEDFGERAAKDADGKTYYVPADTKYEDWKKAFVDGGDKAGVIKSDAVANNKLRQVPGKTSVPKEYIGNYDDFQPLTLTDNERLLLKTLGKNTLEDGFEHGAAIVSGETRFFTSGIVDRVAIPEDVGKMIDAAANRSVHLLHSHTNETLPSATDFRKLLDEKIDKVSIIAYNKDIYSASIGNGWIPTRQEFDVAVKRIAKEVDDDIFSYPGFNEWTIAERNYVGIREQAYRIARHFEWTLEGGAL